MQGGTALECTYSVCYLVYMTTAFENTGSNRPIRIDNELWDAYGDLVGKLGRSKDLRNYIAWRTGAGMDMLIHTEAGWTRIAASAISYAAAPESDEPVDVRAPHSTDTPD